MENEAVKSQTLNSIKFKKLKRRLKLSQWETIGVLESIWQLTAADAWLGNIGKFSNEDIAAHIEWDGDPDELIYALLECGFLDESPKERLVVHDWHEHAPSFVKANAKKHNRKLLSSLPAELPKEAPKEPPKEAPKDTPTKPNLTKPIPNRVPCTVHRASEYAGTEHGTRDENSDSGNCMILHRPEQAQKVELECFTDFMRADVVSIACTLADWWPDNSGKSGPAAGFFVKQLKTLAARIGDEKATETVRQELFRYQSEVRAGEEPRSASAAITARIKAIVKNNKELTRPAGSGGAGVGRW